MEPYCSNSPTPIEALTSRASQPRSPLLAWPARVDLERPPLAPAYRRCLPVFAAAKRSALFVLIMFGRLSLGLNTAELIAADLSQRLQLFGRTLRLKPA